MITAKLYSYSPCEVDYLVEVLTPIATPTDEEYDSKTCRHSEDCETCKIRHACYDIGKLYDFLLHEQSTGYPHCSGK